jgi:putative drug exporter of the RND superfamily
MATFLYKLGKASFRHAPRVIAAWIVAMVVFLGLGITLGGNTQEQFRIPGRESQLAFDRLDAVFPTFAGAAAQAVLVAPVGDRLDSDANTILIERLTQALSASSGVDDAVSPFDEFAGRALTDDGRYGFIQIRFEVTQPEVTDAMLDELTATRDVVAGSGLELEFGGSVFQDQSPGLTIAEVFGVIFAGIVLIVTFRSFRPAWMPLVSAIVGVGIVIGIIFLMTLGMTVSSSAPLLAVMLGLAVGIDYSLFILSRHRDQLARGEDPLESAATAVGTAGNAVVFAGLTVIIALLGLFVVGIPFLSVMGASAAMAVAIAIVAAITLLPALMGLMGERLRPQPQSKAFALATASASKPSMGRRWVRGVMKYPLAVTVVSVVTLGIIALPALSLDLNLPGGGQEPEDSTQRKAYDIISEGFGPGYNGPLLIAVDLTASDDLMDDLESLRDELESVPGVDYVSQGFPSPGLDTGIFQVVPEFAPDSIETKELVADLRERLPQWEDTYGTEMAVTGVTAIGVDVSERIQNALVPFGLVVVGLSIILLLAVFRSVVVPIKAALGFVLSVTGAFGVVVALFQWGWFSELFDVTPGPILSFMPIILMAVLFGLAMDYEVFLVSGMREQQVRTGDWRFAIEEGYAQGARVVTSAALIMFFVFFAFVPEGSNIIKPIAMGLAVGIAFDAFIVRMTLVPALMALFQKTAWWLPTVLDRSVPHADVEGEKLRDHIRDVQWASVTNTYAVHAEYLVLDDNDQHSQPLSLNWKPGERIHVVASPARTRSFAATLSGVLEPRSGALHVAGFPLPSDSTAVRQRVSVWSDSPDAGTLVLGDAISERLRWSAHTRGLTRTQRRQRVDDVIATLNTLGADVLGSGARQTLNEDSEINLLDRRQLILVKGALAVLDGSPVCLVSAKDPVEEPGDVELWWKGITACATAHQTVALFCLPPARSLSEGEPPRSVLDLEAPSLLGVNPR